MLLLLSHFSHVQLCGPHRRQPSRLRHPWDSPGKNTGVGCHYLLQCMKVKSESEVAQSHLTFRDPMDCCLPVSSVHGIFQARVLEWAAIAFSRSAHEGPIYQTFSPLQFAANAEWPQSSWPSSAASRVVVRGSALVIALSWLSNSHGRPLCSLSSGLSSPLQNFLNHHYCTLISISWARYVADVASCLHCLMIYFEVK